MEQQDGRAGTGAAVVDLSGPPLPRDGNEMASDRCIHVSNSIGLSAVLPCRRHG